MAPSHCPLAWGRLRKRQLFRREEDPHIKIKGLQKVFTHAQQPHTWKTTESGSHPCGFRPTADISAPTRAATTSHLPSSHLFGPVCLRHGLPIFSEHCVQGRPESWPRSPEPPTDTCTLVLQHPCERQPGWLSPRLKRPGVPEQFADLIT